ncbi:hypothetical protein VOLCADRAFT_103643 [Volvox carteri f. nagariensis]|uniref:Uncharacterized protein n=1 Tax=Volvox carteri f. nagariensis TaxID=3068 RepID=D8TNL1_VOLCA|nr:uncharacterized protein VOLCADRAFT_103643 [Volvox carteri f. nagariensis]EFJ51009.1 hypothetical protein VOLCADRAFT_103643 [Volvox carteri f. nagariensis]|eukprot:XP_002948021.1 hypothetical protein VOLCADRAFT_103643 [Volvox carteri f. nagariensis]
MRVVPTLKTAPGPLWRLFVEAGLSPRFGTHSLHSEGVTAAVNNRADCSLVQQLGAGRVRRFREHNGEDSTAAGAWVGIVLIVLYYGFKFGVPVSGNPGGCHNAAVPGLSLLVSGGSPAWLLSGRLRLQIR